MVTFCIACLLYLVKTTVCCWLTTVKALLGNLNFSGLFGPLQICKDTYLESITMSFPGENTLQHSTPTPPPTGQN
jgi:hypothetical protein